MLGNNHKVLFTIQIINSYTYIAVKGTLQRDAVISVINSSSNEVIKNITNVGRQPIDIAYNPDNKLMYVADKSVNLISVINSSNKVVKNITSNQPE